MQPQRSHMNALYYQQKMVTYECRTCRTFLVGHLVPDISKTKLVGLDESMKKGVTKDGPTTDDTINVFILETWYHMISVHKSFTMQCL